MLKRHKDLLRPLVGQLRGVLAGTAAADGSWQRGDLDRELERLGVAPDGTLTPLDALPNATAAEQRAHYAAAAALSDVVPPSGGLSRKPPEGGTTFVYVREEMVERAAYTWINRLLALRAMEARGLIEETLRANPDYEGLSEALFVLRQTDPARCAGADGGWWAVVDDACAAQAAALPGLFDPLDPAAALRPSAAALLRCVALVGAAPPGFTLEEADAAFADPDAIGWAYQFYQEAAKARVYAKLGAGGKAATRAEIAAATQLFTEPYMVQWLLQNSLGRSYHEAYPESALPTTWAYYIRQRPEGQQPHESPRPLHALDLIDPCCGSGHFLREAFDMFAAMYREQHPELNAQQIADRILERHLHGIDLDPRAAQLAVLTLYLRAWEFVRDEGRRTKDGRRMLGQSSVVYRPSSLNIATTPSGLSAGALERHLRRHPQDRVLRPLLEGVFAALEQADILGSLLRPGEHIEAAIKALQQPHQMRLDFDADDAALRRTITALAEHDPAELKRVLLNRVAESFAADSGAGDDVAAQLFGREAQQGVRLLQLLDRRYAVVVTNPPYMGSGNMDAPLKIYLEKNYRFGKNDLYAAFILRCKSLTKHNARTAMVTQHGWMFLQSYAPLRIGAKSPIQVRIDNDHFNGLLNENSLESIAHLGRYAFSEIGNALVAPLLFVIQNTLPSVRHSIWACRLASPRPSDEQDILLRKASQNAKPITYVSVTRQKRLSLIPGSPVVYWISDNIAQLLGSERRLESKTGFALVRRGLTTGSVGRFIRYHWEANLKNIGQEKMLPRSGRWFRYQKGGGHKKWAGIHLFQIDWEYEGARIRSGDIPGARIDNPDFYFVPGVTYSLMCSGSMSSRYYTGMSDFSGLSVFPKKLSDWPQLLVLLNNRTCSYFLRVLTQDIKFAGGYTALLPLPKRLSSTNLLGLSAFKEKYSLSAMDMIEDIFVIRSDNSIVEESLSLCAILHTVEGVVEQSVFDLYGLAFDDIASIISETGTPPGFHPLIAHYDALPKLSPDLDLPPLPQEVLDYLASHERISPTPAELTRIKGRLRGLYEAGPGGKEEEPAEAGTTDGEDGEEGEGAVSGAHIPIPTETFLEELSVKMQLHPISVYWLLEELRHEGARCKPEERRLLEDRLSVLVLRLLGHRWPKQIEAGEPVPEWADPDGIIAITGGSGDTTLAERVRARLRAEDGDLGAQQAEALLHELTGLTLEEWLRREFFKRHVRQFKYRPIAWHLVSDPSAATPLAKGRKGDASVPARRGGRRQPAFECLLYYHACGGDALARLRTQYVEPLLRAERQHLEAAQRANDETAQAQSTARIQELEAFVANLRDIAESGFSVVPPSGGPEPLDRWSGDGYLAPASHDDFVRQERAWRVDLNDGVRVNIAPLQLAGLLASDVLKAADAKKAIADRARWRSDERRWVREGKLPRPGWMDDAVPESPAWTALAPQREAEKAKLEAKRQALAQRDT